MTEEDLTDAEHEAKGAMLHAMSTRDYHREQANEVERLKAEVSKLREALKPFAEMVRPGYDDAESLRVISVYVRHCVAAQDALVETDPHPAG